jgi:hypothetical protein
MGPAGGSVKSPGGSAASGGASLALISYRFAHRVGGQMIEVLRACHGRETWRPRADPAQRRIAGASGRLDERLCAGTLPFLDLKLYSIA